MCKPYLIIITGRPGSGKSSLARALGQRLCLPVISRDELKEGYVHTFGKSHAELPAETNKIVSELFFQTVNMLVAANVSLIAEAAFQHRVWEPYLNLLQEKTRMTILICSTTDDQTTMVRLINRGLNDPQHAYFHGDGDIGLARQGGIIEPAPYAEPHLAVPTIRIDTTGVYNPSLEELRKIIFKSADDQLGPMEERM